ncbi:MAG: hypothetical protein L6V95_13620 [Candidatus Melainabacteria bacterium]|nr:MAG: hypothetical protein L6V95_13620 [Candidatus Melainabacteria bacterium]
MSISVNSRKKQSKKSFVELLEDLQTSNSEKVRYNAARVLGEMGDVNAVEPLINVLKMIKTVLYVYTQLVLWVSLAIVKQRCH